MGAIKFEVIAWSDRIKKRREKTVAEVEFIVHSADNKRSMEISRNPNICKRNRKVEVL